MITVLLIVHGLLAVTLLGGLTHQALSLIPVAGGSPRSFVDRFRRVNSAAYVNPVVILFIVTSIGGALLYPQYRIDVRPILEEMNARGANGVFEIKEHLVAIGLGVLPVYWLLWKQPDGPGAVSTRRWLTWLLTFITWWSFLAGHVLNNLKGLVP